MLKIFTALSGLLLLSSVKGTEVPSDFQDFSEISPVISNNCVNAFVQDAAGCVWIATDRGVNRYNGYDFHYWINTDDPGSLPDNQVKSLAVDAQGRLWCGTINGICRYTAEDNFLQIPVNGSAYIKNIWTTSSGELFICTADSIEILEEDADGNERFRLFEPIDDSFCVFAMDSLGHLWRTSDKGLIWYDLDKKTKSTNPIRYDDWCYGLHCHDGRYLYMSCIGSGLKIFDTYTLQFIPLPEVLGKLAGTSGIKKVLGDTGSSLIIYTNSLGLYEWDPQTCRLVSINQDELTDEGKKGILSVTMTDRDGNLWVGTSDQGFGIRRKKGSHFNSDAALAKAFAEKSVTGLCRTDDGAILINTYGYGMWKWKDGKITGLSVNGAKDGYFLQRSAVLSDGYVYTAIPYCVLKLKLSGDDLTVTDAWKVPSMQLYDITEDSKGRIWVGTYSDKVYMIDPGSDEVTPVDIGLGATSSYMAQKAVNVGGGTMAVAVLHSGVVLIDENTLERKLVPISDFYDGRLFIPVSSFLDSKRRLWIGTRGQGLFRYDISSSRIEHIDGISAKDIMAITEDRASNLWISTLNGLYKMLPDSDRKVAYYKSDGTGGDQYNEAAVTLTSSGYPIFGGTHGTTQVSIFDDDRSSTARILFEDVFINNKIQHPYNSAALNGLISRTGTLTLRQKDDVNVGISFCTVDYGLWSSTHFSYRLEGFENDWVDAGGNRRAFYSNLPAGRYRFCVRAWNADYTGIMAEDSISITVLPPWWMAWWMKWLVYPLLGLLLISSGTYFVIRDKKNRATAEEAMRRSENEKRVNDMNMSFFVNVSHEMRTPLAVIKGPLDMLTEDPSISEENHNLLKIMSRNVSRLLRYINQLMDVSKLENDTLSLRVRYVDVTLLINNLLDIFKINAAEKGIKICTRGLDDSLIFLLDDDKIEKILSNLLSNAVKFTTKGGEIEVTLDACEGHLTISVANDGPEIPENEIEKIFLRYYQVASTGGKFNYGTGIGLYYSRRLTELHHGTIEVHNRTDGSGPVFTVRLPLDEKAYASDKRAEDETELTGILAAASTPAEEAPSATSAEERPVMLVVEDETEMARFLKTIFSSDYKVVNRYDADSALRDLASINPDMVICDVMMPGRLDGFGLCRELKNNPDTCHLPVILLTAKVNVESQVQGMDCGADSYITKPFNPNYLKANVRSLLSNRDRLRQGLALSTRTKEISSDKLSPYDREFMDRLYALMEKSLSDPELNTMGIAEAMRISRTKLYYKIKALTGENPNSFFRKYKLNRAAQLLREGRYNISEVADITGFASLSHFSTSFKKQFGVAPSSF